MGVVAESNRTRWCVAALAAAVSCVSLMGCETTRRDALGREVVEPRAREVGPAPAGTRAMQITMSVGRPSDSDANGFPDTIPVVVYLFAATNEYPLSLSEAGSFTFALTSQGGEPLGRWEFGETETARAAQELPPGPGFVFGLRLAPGVDRRPNQPVNVTAVFTSALDARRIESGGAASVLIGSGLREPGPSTATPVDATR